MPFQEQQQQPHQDVWNWENEFENEFYLGYEPYEEDAPEWHQQRYEDIDFSEYWDNEPWQEISAFFDSDASIDDILIHLPIWVRDFMNTNHPLKAMSLRFFIKEWKLHKASPFRDEHWRNVLESLVDCFINFDPYEFQSPPFP